MSIVLTTLSPIAAQAAPAAPDESESHSVIGEQVPNESPMLVPDEPVVQESVDEEAADQLNKVVDDPAVESQPSLPTDGTQMAESAPTDSRPEASNAVPASASRTFHATGTGKLKYDVELSFEDAPTPDVCTLMAGAWVSATTADGRTSWGQEHVMNLLSQKIPFSFDDTGMRYPGGELTLTYYDKEANGASCTESLPPTQALPDDQELISYKQESVNVTWSKPEILDLYPVKDAQGDESLHVEVSSDWTNFHLGRDEGGITFFENKPYGELNIIQLGTAGEIVSPGHKTCTTTDESDRSGLTCKYPLSMPSAGNSLGVAALPNNINPDTVETWPPAEAISYETYVSPEPVAIDARATWAGCSDSAQSHRVCTGDPIDTYSGNFFESLTDLEIPGSIGLSIERQYAVGLLGNTGAFGNGWALNYDMRVEAGANSNKATVVEPSGNQSSFVLSSGNYLPAAANLRADLKRTGTGWEFSRWKEDLIYVFNDAGQLVSIQDENDNIVSIQHDGHGRVASVTEDDRSITFTWSGDLLSAATDHTGRTATYNYTDDVLTSVTNPVGKTSAYVYDSEGRVSSMTNAAGETTTNTYDAKSRIKAQQLPSGQLIELEYASVGQNQITTETSGNVVKEYTYDKHGRIIEFKDASDATASFTRTYDNASNVLSETLIDGSPKKYKYSYTDGNLTSVSEENAGATVSYEYDNERRVTASTDAAGIRTENDYDNAGNLVSTSVIPADESSSRVTSYAVDSRGNTTSVTNPLGGVSTLEYNAADQLISLTDPVGGKTTYSYDSLGRIVEEVSAGGNVSGIAAEDAVKFTTTYTYDAAGNVTSVENATGITSYVYDNLNRPVSITDPDQKTKTVSYDGAGNPEEIIYPDGSTDQFTYNVDTGARSSWTDPQGLTTSYAQTRTTFTTTSPDGKVTSLTKTIGSDYIDTKLIDDEHPSGIRISSQRANRSVSYPENGKSNTANYNAAGQLISEKSDGIDVAYSYDGFGQLLSQSGTNRNVGYTYDAAGNITSITYPDGTSISREMDLAGRITKIADWSGAAYDLSYNNAGQLAGITSSTGLKYVAQYDGLQLVSKNWTDELDAVIASFGYDYQTSGLLSADSKTLGNQPAVERDFQFNDNGALTAVNQDQVSWDSRLLTNTGSTDLAYDPISSRLTAATRGSDTTSFTYDDRGNRLSSSTGGQTTSYEWNLLDQLTSLDSTDYTYGVNGIRTSVDDNAQVYDQGLKLLTDGEIKYLWSVDGALLAQAPLESTAAVDTQLAVTDGMNSVYAVLDEQLASLGQYSYSAFGERMLTAGADLSSIGFTSEQHDASGLIYLRYRYMDPTVGQFISVDPLVSGTLDPYGYASGNPLQMSDPLGLFSFDSFVEGATTTLGIVAAGAGLVALFATAGSATATVAAGIATTAGRIALAGGLYLLTKDCGIDIISMDCLASATGTALGFVTKVPALRELGQKATMQTPKVLSELGQSWFNAVRQNQRFQYAFAENSGLLYDTARGLC